MIVRIYDDTYSEYCSDEIELGADVWLLHLDIAQFLGMPFYKYFERVLASRISSEDLSMLEGDKLDWLRAYNSVDKPYLAMDRDRYFLKVFGDNGNEVYSHGVDLGLYDAFKWGVETDVNKELEELLNSSDIKDKVIELDTLFFR